jgi:cadmium resistance protein CadD (predicted permease)
MIDYLAIVLTGMVIFLITGFDDIMVVFALIHEKTRKQKISVFAGTFFGAMIMLTLSFLLHLIIKDLVSDIAIIRESLKVLLILPIIFALSLIYQTIMETKDYTESTKAKSSKFFVLSCVIYLGNMADDVIFNTTYMLNLSDFQFISGLVIGNLIGCTLMFLMADFFAQKLRETKYKKTIMNVVALIIILLCIRMILS